tara:strand:+ start:5570 stop:5935 length:366 start_codon:yes stop_codon:yes gene_type:complete
MGVVALLIVATETGFTFPSWADLSLPSAFLALLVLIVVSIVRGWLVPKNQHDRELAAANQRTQDAKDRGDEWKVTAREQAGVLTIKDEQIKTLVQTNAVVQDILREASPIQLGTAEPRGGG